MTIKRLIVALISTLMLANMATAQSQFSPAVTVNNSAISNFEIDQRTKLLRLFRTPGNLDELAIEQLIDDRLKLQELDRAGLRLSDEALLGAMEAFAGRANLTLEQFTQLLNSSGVEQASLRDFVRAGVSWRDLVRSRFGSRVEITETEIDRALGRAGGSGTSIEVLLSEIIIPAPPPRAARALAQAQQIAELTSIEAFSAQARRVSALPTRTRGGRLDWLPLSNYPAQLRPLILGLGQGQVTAPIPITNGVALFQMRGVREVAGAAPTYSAVEYAAYYIAGGRSDAALREARRVLNRVDTCDDLYGVAHGKPTEVLDRSSLPPEEIPTDVAIELARLDVGEVSTALTRSDGETLVFLMLCGRTPSAGGDVDRDTVRAQLRSQRLAGYANSLLANLKASAIISYP